jgi:hypothetical protein
MMVPFITVLASPFIDTYDSNNPSDPGVFLDDVLDDFALTGFDPAINLTLPHFQASSNRSGGILFPYHWLFCQTE